MCKVHWVEAVKDNRWTLKSSGLKISGVPVFGSVIPWLRDVFKLFSLSGLPFFHL